ncbi:MAG: non-ribosomal peptide synthetase [Pseudomonadota bacterium]|nr:non-ribosomal peptide synthetase [Pseudomonadota bacterium]
MHKKYKTLNELFISQIEHDGYIRFIDVKSNEKSIQFTEFGEEVLNCLGYLQSQNLRPGDELVINTKSNFKFLVTLWAALLGGIIPVPLAVGINNEHRSKLLKIITRLKNPTLMTDKNVKERLSTFIEIDDNYSSIKPIINNCLIEYEINKHGIIHNSDADDIAFIQYSSGSTSSPKGVVLSHNNLTSNIAAIADGLKLQSDDIGISWMPLTHDMGLIGTHMTLYSVGLSQIVMDTELFIRRPSIWLQKTSEYRASILTSPNFGYKHFLRMHKRKPIEKVDLNCVRLLINGAESISVSLCNEFLETMKPFGLKKESMFPVYGLAEATLGVSFPEVGTPFEYVNIKRKTLNIGDKCDITNSLNNSIPFVMHGKAINHCSYKIFDDKNQELPENYIGHIYVKGANVAKSIYMDKHETKVIFSEEGWLKTGDCGAVINGQLIITGRKKEIIIINGQNYYPHDIEEIITSTGNFDLGKIVACGALNTKTTNDELIVFVLYKSDLSVFKKIAEEIRRIVIQQLGIEIDHVIPITKIPKTTSGKIQRIQLSQQYVNGDFKHLIQKKEASLPLRQNDNVLNQLMSITNEFSKEFAVGESDNLFEIGISSLTLTEIMMAIEEIYPDTVHLEDVFENPTLKELSLFINSKKIKGNNLNL